MPAHGTLSGVTDAAAPSDLADPVAQVIRQRRTSLLVDPAAEVSRDLVEDLIELACWAPNHKRTWPWRFTVLTDAARGRFGEALAEAAAAEGGVPPEKVAKLRTKYLRSSTVVLVWVRVDGDAVRRTEDRDAVAAAVQNLLLGATARGLASYWGSLAPRLVDAARGFCGVADDHDLVALVYLGWPSGTVATPVRPPAEVRWIG